MACTLQRPGEQALFDHYLNGVSTHILGGAPVIPESNEWYVASLHYAMAEEYYAISEQEWKERDPRYACCENLQAIAAAKGVFPRAATYAQGYAIITGVVDSPLPSAIEIIASNGRNYRSVSRIPPVMPSEGSITIRVQDITPGPGGNSAGTTTTATLATGITGLDSAVVICGGSFCGGKDAETCAQFRTRYIEREQYQPRATQAWAISKMLEWPCVTRVIPRGGNCCQCSGAGDETGCITCGTSLDFYVMFDDAFPCGISPSNITEEISTWFFGPNPGFGQGEAEMGVCGRIIQPNPFLVDVFLDIVGCPTVSQVTLIRERIIDLFRTFAPSTDISSRQVELIASNVVGPGIDVFARYEIVSPDENVATLGPCGDLLVACDSVPCLRNVTLTGPTQSAGSTC